MAIDLNALLKQRAEATGVVEGRVAFTFNDETFTFKDPLLMDDAELADVVDSDFAPDICIQYMGEEEYVRFVNAGGNSMMWGLVFKQHLDDATDIDSKGKGGRSKRFVKNLAAQKR